MDTIAEIVYSSLDGVKLSTGINDNVDICDKYASQFSPWATYFKVVDESETSKIVEVSSRDDYDLVRLAFYDGSAIIVSKSGCYIETKDSKTPLQNW